jgi:hypothetical protein
MSEAVCRTLFPKENTVCLVTIVVGFLLVTLPWEYSFAKQTSLSCNIRPKRGTPAASLPALATVSQADAERTALASLKTSAPTTVTERELELEHGCLVYSFDIKVAGKDGIEEVLIDAGTGKVLSHEHESAKREAAEKTEEKKAHRRP